MSQNYNANYVKRAQQFAKSQNQIQQSFQRDVIVPSLDKKYLRGASNTWGSTLPKNSGEMYNLELINQQNVDALTSRLPFTYTIPEEEKFVIRRRFTDDLGNAKFDFMGKNQAVGKVMLSPEYWDFVIKEMEREEAMALKTFIFNTMLKDFDRPTGKKYWKKRCPELFQELKDALKAKAANQYRKACIALDEPQNEDDFKFVYDQFVHPNIYATVQSMPDTIPNDMYDPQGWPNSQNIQKYGVYNTFGSNIEGNNPYPSGLYHIKTGQSYDKQNLNLKI